MIPIELLQKAFAEANKKSFQNRLTSLPIMIVPFEGYLGTDPKTGEKVYCRAYYDGDIIGIVNDPDKNVDNNKILFHLYHEMTHYAIHKLEGRWEHHTSRFMNYMMNVLKSQFPLETAERFYKLSKHNDNGKIVYFNDVVPWNPLTN